jgi:hypothetical protein
MTMKTRFTPPGRRVRTAPLKVLVGNKFCAELRDDNRWHCVNVKRNASRLCETGQYLVGQQDLLLEHIDYNLSEGLKTQIQVMEHIIYD